MNMRNLGNGAPSPYGDGGVGRPPGNFLLTRQPSVYSLTFDEFQSTVSGAGKDFGSMNMDELLKSIWSAEDTHQTMEAPGGKQGGAAAAPVGDLQKQGSLTLPRTLSQKTVDEVWKNISKEQGGANDGNGNGSTGLDFQQQRQQTLGEMTLEEFLLKAGVVRECTTQLNDKSNTLGVGFQQIHPGSGLMGNRILESNNQMGMQPINLPLNVNGARHPQQRRQHQQDQELFCQQATAAYTPPMSLPISAQLGSTRITGGYVGLAEPSMNNNLARGTGLHGAVMGMVGAGPGSPGNHISSDGLGRSNEDSSSLSPVQYMFNGVRGRKRSGAVDKVVERRQRRMIKNRESAARSRARKQAHTMELEAEVNKLKEMNRELQKKRAETEIQKNRALEMVKSVAGGKRRCLRRTRSGPW